MTGTVGGRGPRARRGHRPVVALETGSASFTAAVEGDADLVAEFLARPRLG